MLEITVAIGLTLAALTAWIAGVLGLPGNWILVALAAAVWGLAGPESMLAMSSAVLISLVVLAGIGELVEFLAGALGVKKLGGSTRSTWYAVGGSLVGAMAGLVVGSGIPVIGNIVASILGSALGALVGAVYGERTDGKHWEHSLQVGGAAFIGRILGTLSKLLLGSVMLIIFVSAIWF